MWRLATMTPLGISISPHGPDKIQPGVHRNYHLAMHVDTDEANAFNSDTEPYGVIVRFFDSNFNTDKWIEDELSGIRR